MPWARVSLPWREGSAVDFFTAWKIMVGCYEECEEPCDLLRERKGARAVSTRQGF